MSSGAPPVLIDVDSISKRFGAISAVEQVSFRVARGDVLGFLGPNGAGKTTTMRMIVGFLPPSAGTAIVCGADVRRNPVAVKRSLGYLPEGAPLYGDMTPAGLLNFVAAVRGLSGAKRRERIDEVVARMQLDEVLQQPIDTLSKGFRRRVALAQAILHDPEVLVLDEPTDGLDPNQKHEVRDLILAMAAEKAIVVSTHILEEVEAICNRAIIIARGRIVADGTPEELRSRSEWHNAVMLRLRAEIAEQAIGVLTALPEVARVGRVGLVNGMASLLVVPRQGDPILDAVAGAVRRQQLEVAELFTERGRLDDVFRRITTTPQ
jgi:ABC-2 type transport system ATP-binding protein